MVLNDSIEINVPLKEGSIVPSKTNNKEAQKENKVAIPDQNSSIDIFNSFKSKARKGQTSLDITKPTVMIIEKERSILHDVTNTAPEQIIELTLLFLSQKHLLLIRGNNMKPSKVRKEVVVDSRANM